MKNTGKIISITAPDEAAPEYKGIVHTKTEKISAWAMQLPALERQGIAAAMDYVEGLTGEEKVTALLAVERVISARIRGIKRHQNDVKKRTLIGARVNREFANMCKQAARASGRSVTKWCYAALMDALLKQGQIVEEQLPNYASNASNIWYGW